MMCLLDIMSQLELGKPQGKRKPEKRVNGIFWILLLNLGIYVADHVFQVWNFPSFSCLIPSEEIMFNDTNAKDLPEPSSEYLWFKL